MTTLLARGQITIAAIKDGTDGKPGKDGVSVSVVSTTVEYQIGSSATSAPTSGWSTTVKQATDAQPYLWSRTVVKYSDGKSTTTYGVAYKGKNGTDGKNYWQQDVWVDLSAATYDQNTWYTVVGEQLPQNGFAGIKVVVNLNSGTKPSWSTHSAGFSVDFHIDTQASGWGTTLAETIIYSDTFNFCPVSPVSYKQLGYGSRPILYLRGGGKYRVFSTYNAAWKIYKDGYTWQSGQYSQSAKPSSSRPTPEGHTLKGDKGNKGDTGDRGPQGPTGAAGKDAVSASFSPAALTFSATTDSNGNALANTGSGNTATITMLEGSSVVTGTYSITTKVGCEADISSNTVTVKSVAHDTIEGRAISRTSASVTVKCVYNGKTCYVSLPISVSVSAVWGGLVTSQKGLESKYTEVSNKYNALPLKTDNALTQYTSTIKQSAKEISLKVAQTAVGRKNLLVGSAFCKQSDKWKGNDSYIPYISVLNQYNGHNSVVLENGANTYHGLNFIRVPVKTGKYTAGVMAKFNGKPENGSFAIYVARKDAAGKQIGNNSWIPVDISNVVVGQWSLYSTSFDIEDKCKLIDLCFIYINNPTAWFAQPMLVEGDEYVGWSLSEEDAEYIGGNLLDNTDTLSVGGNLVIASGNLYTDANSYKGFPTRQVNMMESTNAFLGVLEWDLSGDGVLKQGQDYILSFWAKGNIGGKFVAYLYKDGKQVVYTEVLDRVDGPNQHQAADGNAGVTFKEDYAWRKYWVHWRVTGSNLPKYVQIRCMKGCDLYVSQPKLEYGATVTEYRATKTDYIEDKSVAGKLLDAGIDINSREITMTADKTNFRTRSGKKMAVFDENGINADLINAKHVWAKSEDGTSTVGHFGNYEPDYCKVSDNVYAPLFLGSDTAANARFYVTSTGAIKATAGYIGDFTIEGGSLVNEYDKKSMRLGGSNIIFENTSEGKFDLKMGSSVLSEIVGVNTQGGLYLNMKRNYPTSTTSGSETQVNMGLLLNVSGTMDKASREHPWIVNSGIPNGNHAIFIGQGDIAGFRPMLTKATTSRALSKMECVVVCEYPSTSYITLTLPDDPEIGQYYKIIQLTGRYTGKAWGKTYIKSNRSDKPISTYGLASTQTASSDWQFQVNEFWYDGTRWIWQWHMNV